MSTALLAVKAAVLTPRRRYLLRHTFSGASLTPSDQGPNLAVLSGAMTVSGGTLKNNGVANSRAGVTLAANVTLEAKFRFASTSASADQRVVLNVRSDLVAASDNNLYNNLEVVASKTGAYIQLGSRAGGSLTDISTVGLAWSADTDYWMRVVASGSRIEVLTSTNGTAFTSRIVATSALYPTQTGIEARIQDSGSDGNGANGATIDSVTVTTP